MAIVVGGVLAKVVLDSAEFYDSAFCGTVSNDSSRLKWGGSKVIRLLGDFQGFILERRIFPRAEVFFEDLSSKGGCFLRTEVFFEDLPSKGGCSFRAETVFEGLSSNG